MRDIIRALVTALGLIVGVIFYGMFKQKQGKVEAKEELHFDDMKNALDIRDKAQEQLHEIKDTVSRLPIESVHDGLRSKGKLRD